MINLKHGFQVVKMFSTYIKALWTKYKRKIRIENYSQINFMIWPDVTSFLFLPLVMTIRSLKIIWAILSLLTYCHQGMILNQ